MLVSWGLTVFAFLVGCWGIGFGRKYATKLSNQYNVSQRCYALPETAITCFLMHFQSHQPWGSEGWHKAKLANCHIKTWPLLFLFFFPGNEYTTLLWEFDFFLTFSPKSASTHKPLGLVQSLKLQAVFSKNASQFPLGWTANVFFFPRRFYWRVLKNIRSALPDQTKGSFQSGTASCHTVTIEKPAGKPQQGWANNPLTLFLSDAYCSAEPLSHHGKQP